MIGTRCFHRFSSFRYERKENRVRPLDRTDHPLRLLERLLRTKMGAESACMADLIEDLSSPGYRRGLYTRTP